MITFDALIRSSPPPAFRFSCLAPHGYNPLQRISIVRQLPPRLSVLFPLFFPPSLPPHIVLSSTRSKVSHPMSLPYSKLSEFPRSPNLLPPKARFYPLESTAFLPLPRLTLDIRLFYLTPSLVVVLSVITSSPRSGGKRISVRSTSSLDSLQSR